VSLVEFVDGRKVEWKVWDITPDAMHPVTAREMFHGRYADFQEGWLVFESATERRRLAPFPSDWARYTTTQLEELLSEATPVPTRLARTPATPSGAFRRFEEERAHARASGRAPDDVMPPAIPDEDAEGSEETVVRAEGGDRILVGPTGRRWLVAVVARPAAGESAGGGRSPERALRFTSDHGAVCELDAFPDDWARLTRDRLLGLLRRATPVASSAAGQPRRRREDYLP
jgi:hypothetical protein